MSDTNPSQGDAIVSLMREVDALRAENNRLREGLGCARAQFDRIAHNLVDIDDVLWRVAVGQYNALTALLDTGDDDE